MAADPDLTALRADADAAIEHGDLSTRTLVLLEALIEQCPTEIAWPNARGRCLVALGRFEEAEQAFLNAGADGSSNPVATSQLKKLRRRMRQRERAERLLATSPGALLAAVADAKRRGSDADFEVEGRRLLARRDPENVAAVCALGAAQRRAQDHEGALNTYHFAMTLNHAPHTAAMARVGLAAVLRDLDRRPDAHRLCTEVLTTNPNNRHALLGLAALHLDTADADRDTSALAEAKRLLDKVWSLGERSSELKDAYHRYDALSARS
jgi:tetratricopeptide (TPR) repeat protein